MKTNINGQLWIDKNSPYKLKYTMNNNVFELNTAVVYEIGGTETFEAGSLLALRDGVDTNNKPYLVTKAKFPDDLDNIVGIAGNKVSETERHLTILSTGAISMTLAEAQDLFKSSNIPSAKTGDPIYWYIGNFEYNNSDNTYTHSYNKNSDAGKLTLKTPSGSLTTNKYLNVGYDNLPSIGNIYSVSDEEVKVFINLKKFDTSLEWNWPFSSSSDTWDLDSESIKIRHGLLTENSECFCNVVAIDTTTHKEYNVTTNIINHIESGDQYTEIYLGADTSYKYRISGTVNYKF